MAVKYEWKETRGGGRRFVRTVVPDEPKATATSNGEPVAVDPGMRVYAPDPPVVAELEPVETVEEAEVIEPPKRKRGRPRKVAVDE